MTIVNATKGLKNIIQHREQFIKNLDNMTKGWKDECAKGIIDAIKDFMTRDIGSFEYILGEVKNTKITRVSFNNRKK